MAKGSLGFVVTKYAIILLREKPLCHGKWRDEILPEKARAE
jgi:hypothetical protein